MQTFINTYIKAKTFKETLMTGMQSGYGLSYWQCTDHNKCSSSTMGLVSTKTTERWQIRVTIALSWYLINRPGQLSLAIPPGYAKRVPAKAHHMMHQFQIHDLVSTWSKKYRKSAKSVKPYGTSWRGNYYKIWKSRTFKYQWQKGILNSNSKTLWHNKSTYTEHSQMLIQYTTLCMFSDHNM